MKIDFKKYAIFFIGILLFATGISFGIKSLLGGDPMSILVVGINNHVSLSLGTCNLIVAGIEIAVGYILDKKNVTIISLIAVFLGSYTIDLASFLIPDASNMIVKIIYMILGVLLYCFGISLQQYANIGLGNLDCFIFGLMKAFKVKTYRYVRWIVEASFIIVGYLLGGIFGIGTIIILCFSGILIESFKKIETNSLDK